MIYSALGPNIRAVLAQVRRMAEVKLADSKEVLRSGGEDGLYRVHLANGLIVECTIIPRTRVEAELTLH